MDQKKYLLQGRSVPNQSSNHQSRHQRPQNSYNRYKEDQWHQSQEFRPNNGRDQIRDSTRSEFVYSNEFNSSNKPHQQGNWQNKGEGQFYEQDHVRDKGNLNLPLIDLLDFSPKQEADYLVKVHSAYQVNDTHNSHNQYSNLRKKKPYKNPQPRFAHNKQASNAFRNKNHPQWNNKRYNHKRLNHHASDTDYSSQHREIPSPEIYQKMQTMTYSDPNSNSNSSTNSKILKAPYLRLQTKNYYNGINQLREPTLDNYIHQHLKQSKTKHKKLIRKKRHINFMKEFDHALETDLQFQRKYSGLNLFDQEHFHEVCRLLKVNWIDGNIDYKAGIKKRQNFNRICFINSFNHESNNVRFNHSFMKKEIPLQQHSKSHTFNNYQPNSTTWQ